MAKWDELIALRDDVNGVLESARADKRIGKPLDAAVTLYCGDEASKKAVEDVKTMDLSELFIVSECLLADGEPDSGAVVGKGEKNPGLTVSVAEAQGEKCPRCWIHTRKADPQTGLCPRCAAVVAAIG